MEVVSEPDMRSADEARSYLTRLRSILQYIRVSTANMEEGSFRCDANISIRPHGSEHLGAKVEVKNMNSFRAVYRALEFEADRQMRAAREGERIVQETRGWVEERGVTVSQRTKEYASDYRYFPDPDLPPLLVSSEWVERIRKAIPELPETRKERLREEYGLSEYDANLLTVSKDTADYFESVIAASEMSGEAKREMAKSASNWILGELTRLLNSTGGEIANVRIRPKQLIELVMLLDGGTLNSTTAKTVFEEMFATGASPGKIVETSGLSQISDTDSIRSAVQEAISGNPQPVGDYLSGKETAMRFLVGQVMKSTRGKANPLLVSELLKRELEALRR